MGQSSSEWDGKVIALLSRFYLWSWAAASF
jgi:hypothetical protein